jgi:hypothetical protein
VNLNSTWFVDSPLDFEHKKWTLLAYIQNIHKNFGEKIIFPYLDDVRFHLSNLEKWQATRELIIKKELKGIDWENLTLIYDIPECSPEMNELQKIIDWSYPRLQKMDKLGRILWSEIENGLEIEYRGIWFNNEREGNIVLQTPILTNEYKYTISPIISNNQITFTKIETYLTKTINEKSIKNSWWVRSPGTSIEGSLEPIVKKNLIKWINNI